MQPTRHHHHRALLAAALATALSCATAKGVHCAASSNLTETIFLLTSNPPPTQRPETGHVRVSGIVTCDNGSIFLKLAGDDAAQTPALTVVFAPGEILLAHDGGAPEDVSGETQGTGPFEFHLEIRNAEQRVKRCLMKTRPAGGNGAFETVARLDWPTPRFPGQEPLAWLGQGTARAGLAGDCGIEAFRIEKVVPGALFMVR